MKCKECNIDIPATFVSAIKNNICPSCGASMMDTNIVDLMTGLAEAMEKMDYSPFGIAGWLLSNYKMEKVGDCEITEFPDSEVKNKPAQEKKRGGGFIKFGEDQPIKPKPVGPVDSGVSGEDFMKRALGGTNTDPLKLLQMSVEAAQNRKETGSIMKSAPPVIPPYGEDIDSEGDGDSGDSSDNNDGFRVLKDDEMSKIVGAAVEGPMRSGTISKTQKNRIKSMVNELNEEKNMNVHPDLQKIAEKQQDLKRQMASGGISATDGKGNSVGFRRASV